MGSMTVRPRGEPPTRIRTKVDGQMHDVGEGGLDPGHLIGVVAVKDQQRVHVAVTGALDTDQAVEDAMSARRSGPPCRPTGR